MMSQSPTPTSAMGIGTMLNNKNGSSTAQVAQSTAPDLQSQQHPQLAIDRANSPHGSENSRYSGPVTYPSPTVMDAGLPVTLPSIPTSSVAHSGIPPVPMGLPGIHPAFPTNLMQTYTQQSFKPVPAPVPPPPKAYPCSTCGKGFARRSDLARHERIHSGIRPHVCDYTGCGKQFIQRSALTVHQRVHTGEKPHLCERCGKPFSDSSSLARHRRIHSGKRPYKCPYADCQKTFTRRTTLTRHQNHHTGTIEDAARATAEALARGATNAAAAAVRAKTASEGEQASNHGSPISTPSPSQRNMSMSPGAEIAGINSMAYMGNSSLPVHLRGDVHAASPASTASSGYNNSVRPTSHPIGYGPPSTLEPNVEPQQGPGSASPSPHMGSAGWQSPSHIPSPTHSANGSGYVYPDPEAYPGTGAPIGQIFYNNTPAPMRRPGSAEPGSMSYEVKSENGANYDVKPRPSELWAGGQ